MNKKLTIILLAVMVVVIIVAVILWPKKKPTGKSTKKTVTDNDANTLTPTPKPTAPTQPKTVNAITAALNTTASFPLRLGSGMNTANGLDEVKLIQTGANRAIMLGAIRGSLLTVDGKWGPKTDAAVKQIYSTGQITREQYTNLVLWITMGGPLQ